MRTARVSILPGLLVAGCTADEVARSAYGGAKGACHLNPGQCMVSPQARQATLA